MAATIDYAVNDILQLLKKTTEPQTYGLALDDAPGQHSPSGLGAVMAALGSGSGEWPSVVAPADVTPQQSPALMPQASQQDTTPSSMLARMMASQQQGPVVPPGLMPTSVPTNHFDKHQALRGAGTVGGILAIMNALGVISPETMGQVAGPAIASSIEGPRQEADAQYKEEMGAYTQRHQLVSDYINAARLQQLQNYQALQGATNIDKGNDAAIKEANRVIASISPTQYPTPEAYDAAVEAKIQDVSSDMTPEMAKTWVGTVQSHKGADGHYPDMGNALSYLEAQRGKTQGTQQILNEDKHQINLHTISTEQIGDLKHIGDTLASPGFALLPPSKRASLARMLEHAAGLEVGVLGIPKSLAELNEALKERQFDLTKQNVTSEITRRKIQSEIENERTGIMAKNAHSTALIAQARADYYRFMTHIGQPINEPANPTQWERAHNAADSDYKADDALLNNPVNAVKYIGDQPGSKYDKIHAMAIAHQSPHEFMNDPQAVPWMKDATVKLMLQHALLYDHLSGEEAQGKIDDNPDAPATISPNDVKPISKHPAYGGFMGSLPGTNGTPGSPRPTDRGMKRWGSIKY